MTAERRTAPRSDASPKGQASLLGAVRLSAVIRVQLELSRCSADCLCCHDTILCGLSRSLELLDELLRVPKRDRPRTWPRRHSRRLRQVRLLALPPRARHPLVLALRPPAKASRRRNARRDQRNLP